MRKIHKNDRLEVFEKTLTFMAGSLTQATIISVHVDKSKPVTPMKNPTPDLIHMRVWGRLLERFDTHLSRNCQKASAILVPDDGDEYKLRRLVRRMRVFNFVSRQGVPAAIPLLHIVE